jgi:toxin ParE1/3/4
MAKLDTHPAAQAEYEAAIRWYAQESTAAARRFVGEVEAAMRAILGHPDRYSRLDATHRLYLLNRFPYYVAYRQLGDLVQVIAIRHSSQDQDVWKAR